MTNADREEIIATVLDGIGQPLIPFNPKKEYRNEWNGQMWRLVPVNKFPPPQDGMYDRIRNFISAEVSKAIVGRPNAFNIELIRDQETDYTARYYLCSKGFKFFRYINVGVEAEKVTPREHLVTKFLKTWHDEVTNYYMGIVFSEEAAK